MKYVPVHLTKYPDIKIVVPKPVQDVPSELYAIEFTLPEPTARNKLFPYTIDLPYKENILVPRPVHVVLSEL